MPWVQNHSSALCVLRSSDRPSLLSAGRVQTQSPSSCVLRYHASGGGTDGGQRSVGLYLSHRRRHDEAAKGLIGFFFESRRERHFSPSFQTSISTTFVRRSNVMVRNAVAHHPGLQSQTLLQRGKLAHLSRPRYMWIYPSPKPFIHTHTVYSSPHHLFLGVERRLQSMSPHAIFSLEVEAVKLGVRFLDTVF